MPFSQDQKRIATLLVNGSKSEQEISKQLNIPYDKLLMELKDMLKTKVLLKEGYPTKYRLKQDIIDEVKRRKEISSQDEYKIRIRAIIELQAVEKTLLKKHYKKIKEALKKEKNFNIYSISDEKVADDGDMCSTFTEVNLSVKDFSSLVKFIFYYGPASIEVLKPSRVEFSQFEFQEGLVDLANILQSYATFTQQHLTREEINKFNKEVYS